MSELKKLSFADVCDGNMLEDASEEFEKILSTSAEKGVRCEMTIKLAILPPQFIAGSDYRTCDMSYVVSSKECAPKASRYTAMIDKSGSIVRTDTSADTVLNERLDLDGAGERNVVNFK